MFNIFRKKNSNQLSYYKLSVIGKREVNQDESIVLSLGESNYFLAVADGMGGTANGDIASNIAINVAFDILEIELKDKKDINPKHLKDILQSVYLKIQNVLKIQISQNSGLAGMGTTLACLLIYEGKYVWGNIGDSRIYRSNFKELNQITEDHNYLTGYKKENNVEVPSEIKSKYGHLLTRCLDGGEDFPEIFPLDKEFELLTDNELFLLCSDGMIINNFKFKNFKAALKSGNLKKTGHELISESYKEGSTDNITIILFRSIRK